MLHAMHLLGAVVPVVLVAFGIVAGCVGDDVLPTTSGPDDGVPIACTDSQKKCNDVCVAKEDPTVGCAAASCAACPTAINAEATCKAGACAFRCRDGAADCDGNPATGCEVKTSSDASNCGACGKTCGAANTVLPSQCEAGHCAFSCKKDFAHCASDEVAGCETDLANDPLHCGACGHSCLGGECVGRKCQPFLVVSMSDPHGIAVDAKHVYISSIQAAAIRRVGHDGTCAPASPCPADFAGTTVGDDLAKVRGAGAIATDGANVYWVAQAGATLSMKPVAGGAITKSWGPAHGGVAGTLAIGGGKVWWTNAFGTVDPTPHLFAANLDGSDVASHADYSTPVGTFQGLGGVVVDGSRVFWASPNASVYGAPYNAAKCTEGGLGNCTNVGSSGAFGVAVDDTYVYWTEPSTTPGTGSVKRALKTGGGGAWVAKNQDKPNAIAVQDGYVYWGNVGTLAPTGGSVRRARVNVATCDGEGCELVAKVPSPRAVVSADDGVYWTNEAAVGGGVWRLAR